MAGTLPPRARSGERSADVPRTHHALPTDAPQIGRPGSSATRRAPTSLAESSISDRRAVRPRTSIMDLDDLVLATADHLGDPFAQSSWPASGAATTTSPVTLRRRECGLQVPPPCCTSSTPARSRASRRSATAVLVLRPGCAHRRPTCDMRAVLRHEDGSSASTHRGGRRSRCDLGGPRADSASPSRAIRIGTMHRFEDDAPRVYSPLSDGLEHGTAASTSVRRPARTASRLRRRCDAVDRRATASRSMLEGLRARRAARRLAR